MDELKKCDICGRVMVNQPASIQFDVTSGMTTYFCEECAPDPFGEIMSEEE